MDTQSNQGQVPTPDAENQPTTSEANPQQQQPADTHTLADTATDAKGKLDDAYNKAQAVQSAEQEVSSIIDMGKSILGGL
ncbi:MAG TPA: hypothetical protein VMU25_00150 [Candidatus Paceibacterota bacterium]|nr:hypothetical protein [Candidatus Paceibacterota bacterium]